MASISQLECSRFNLQGGITILFQLLLITTVVHFYQIIPGSYFSELFPALVICCVVNALLPLRFRQSFVVLIGFGLVYYLFGWVSGSVIIGIGLTLIGICHLPFSKYIKWLLILAIVLTLALLRLEYLFAPRLIIAVPVLGAIFMFRLIVYAYYLQYETKGSVTVWQRLGYFFMFPNLFFPLFPIVDYKLFTQGYYSAPAVRIAQKGVNMLMWGIVHLVIYRLVYAHLTIQPNQVTDVLSLSHYVSSTYLLIFRMSGMLHLAVGLLCLFGYDLPYIFKNFLLADSFSDIWRRINIYWKDFMQKIFYYPMYFKFKKYSEAVAITISTLIVFLLSWFFHDYQWFWIRGSFQLSSTDALFWVTLGVFIALNVLFQYSNRSRLKTPKGERFKSRSSILRMLRIIGIFSFMAVIWSMWSSSSVNEWQYLVSYFHVGTIEDYTLLFLFVLGLLLLGIAINYVYFSLIKDWWKKATNYSMIYVCLVCFVLVIPVLPIVRYKLPIQFNEFISSAQQLELSETDVLALDEGYYEGLLGIESNNIGVWQIQLHGDKNWQSTSGATRPTEDLFFREFIPNVNVEHRGFHFNINRWGMRDLDYELRAPEGTYRISLLGGSYEVGFGVEMEDTYQAIVENKLNTITESEVLNHAFLGNVLIQNMETTLTKIPAFTPNMVVYVGHPDEVEHTAKNLANLVMIGVNMKYSFLYEIKELAGADQYMSKLELTNRFRPYCDTVISWAYGMIVNKCEEIKATPVWIYIPTAKDEQPEIEYENLNAKAVKAGFKTINLADVFGDYSLIDIRVSETDYHPNELGHQLIADAIFAELLLLNSEHHLWGN